MFSPPNSVSVVNFDSKEFITFYNSICPGQPKLDGGTLIKYSPCGWFAKIGSSLVLLFLSFGFIFFPDNGQRPFGSTFIGTIFLLLLCVCIKARFDETWFLLSREQLFIKRWRYVIPGSKITVFERKNIRSVDYRANLKIPKAPQSYTMQFLIKGLDSKIDVMTDTHQERISWLTKAISSWRKNGSL